MTACPGSRRHRIQLSSAREDVPGDLIRARYRLGKFLLRRGIVYPGPGGAWTQAHLAWLTRLRFDDDASTVTLAEYLAAVQALVQRRGTLAAAIVRLVPSSRHAAAVPVLRCFRGIDTLSAAGLCAEIGDFARFAHPKLLAGFLGIVPSEYTSDDTRRQGAITKAGPGHARRLLVEAAHHYRRPPCLGAALARGRPARTHGCAPSRGEPNNVSTASGSGCAASVANHPVSSRSPVLVNCRRFYGRPHHRLISHTTRSVDAAGTRTDIHEGPGPSHPRGPRRGLWAADTPVGGARY